MKILGIDKIYFDRNKLRCNVVYEADIENTITVDLESEDKINQKILEKLEAFTLDIINILEKESLI